MFMETTIVVVRVMMMMMINTLYAYSCVTMNILDDELY